MPANVPGKEPKQSKTALSIDDINTIPYGSTKEKGATPELPNRPLASTRRRGTNASYGPTKSPADATPRN